MCVCVCVCLRVCVCAPWHQKTNMRIRAQHHQQTHKHIQTHYNMYIVGSLTARRMMHIRRSISSTGAQHHHQWTHTHIQTHYTIYIAGSLTARRRTHIRRSISSTGAQRITIWWVTWRLETCAQLYSLRSKVALGEARLVSICWTGCGTVGLQGVLHASRWMHAHMHTHTECQPYGCVFVYVDVGL